VGFFYNALIGGRGNGDMVFVWSSPVCFVDFEPYLQQIFWEGLEKKPIVDDRKSRSSGCEFNELRTEFANILAI
jgi:hypothetical protein